MQIRSAEEILATLDADADLGALPFMPEMLQFCGRTLTVSKRADKTCDTIEWTGLRRMDETVHLAGLRCDGSAHGGCQAGCLLFWKEDWLKPPDADAVTPRTERGPASVPEGLSRATRVDDGAEGADGARYRCQATQLFRATAPEPWWDVRQYIRDVRSGNAGLLRLVHGLLVFLFNKYQGLSKRVLPRRLRIRSGRWYPFVTGPNTKTPRETLDLQPGELVEVKAREEILATLNNAGHNRGLSFDAEMLPYCGQQFRVLRRVERIIDEKSGRMLTMPRDCIILAGVTCQAIYHRFCPRAIYPYWREIWLRRVEH